MAPVSLDALPLLDAAQDDLRATRQTKAHLDLLTRLDELEDEAQRAKERWVRPEMTEDELKLYRGEWKRDPGARVFFEANFIQAFVDRMTAQLTEVRPTLRIEHRKATLKLLADVLQTCAARFNASFSASPSVTSSEPSACKR